MKVAIIKYNAGNIRSVDYALQRLGVTASITNDPGEIRAADKVIFPGVGEAQSTMAHLESNGLGQLITGLRQPVLGICLGLQLLCAHSEEGDTDCLGIFPARVRKFQSTSPLIKVPHMGWNAIADLRGGLFDGMEDGAYVYFVHSYFAETGPYTTAVTGYIQHFSAALQRGNFYATQFHPEKSGPTGSRILENFLRIKP